MNLRYTERAQEDLEVAVSWYEKQKHGLGLEFLDSVESSLKRIKSSPHMYEIIYASHRRCLIRRFPFSLFPCFIPLKPMGWLFMRCLTIGKIR